MKTLYKRDGDPVFHLILHPNGGRFTGPVNNWTAKIFISQDNRSLIAVGFDSTKGVIVKVLTYDISDLTRVDDPPGE